MQSFSFTRVMYTARPDVFAREKEKGKSLLSLLRADWEGVWERNLGACDMRVCHVCEFVLCVLECDPQDPTRILLTPAHRYPEFLPSNT